MMSSDLGSDILSSAVGVGSQVQAAAPKQALDESSDAGLDFIDVLNSQNVEDKNAKEIGSAEMDMFPSPQLSHQIAMLTFMGQMKTEFDIEPEQIVAAFAQLKPEDLSRPAKENIQKIVSQLGIPVEQQPKACLELEEMLKVTEVEEEDNNSNKVDPKSLASIPLTQDALIAQMNMAQIQTTAPKPTSSLALHAKSSIEESVESVGRNQDRNEDASSKTTGLLGPSLGQGGASVGAGAGVGVAMSSASSAPVVASVDSIGGSFNLADMTQKVSMPSSEISAIVSKSGDQKLDTVLAEKSGGGSEGEALMTPESKLTPSSHATLPTIATTSIGAASGGAALGKMFSGGDDESSEKSEKDEARLPLIQSYAGDGTQAKNVGDFSPVGMKMDSKSALASQDTNLKEVIGQAQFLAKKGGGEMRVQLKPEGLGEVSMNVKVQDGQVSVQMVTQSGEAKKLIEHGLSDLKTSLQSHQLDLGIVRVDVARDTSSQMDHHREQGGRHFAQGMLEDFRGQQNSQRQYPTAAESLTRPSYRAPARDAVTVGYSPGLRGALTSSSRRLDLVA